MSMLTRHCAWLFCVYEAFSLLKTCLCSKKTCFLRLNCCFHVFFLNISVSLFKQLNKRCVALEVGDRVLGVYIVMPRLPHKTR